MRNKILTLGIVFLSGLLSTLNVSAQKQWTLEDCIKYALENNIDIKRKQLQTQAAANNYRQSKFNLLPDLNANGSLAIERAKVYDTTSRSYVSNTSKPGRASLESNLTLFNGLQNYNNINFNKFNFLGTQENLKKAMNDISLQIASAYLQVLFSKEILETTKSQREVTQLRVDKTEKLVEVGNAAKGALLEIKAQAAAEDASVTDARNQLFLSYLSLTQMLDLDTVKNFTVFTPDTIMVPETFFENADSMYNYSLNNLPEIKSAQYDLMAYKSKLAIARGLVMPNIYLNAAYSTSYNIQNVSSYPVADQLSDHNMQSISLNISIPLFNRLNNYTKISNAKIDVLDAEYGLRQSQLQLRKEIQQAYADATAAFDNFKSRYESVLANEENFKYYQQKFDVGLINIVDYNVAKNNYIKAQSELLQAKYEFVFKTKVLDFYKGEPIKL
jgi:outer membrane protein